MRYRLRLFPSPSRSRACPDEGRGVRGAGGCLDYIATSEKTALTPTLSPWERGAKPARRIGILEQ